MKNKKRKIVMIMMIMSMLLLIGCGKQNSENFDQFIGKWQCAENPLEHPDYYTGYLVMSIEEDASFRMYDAEAGNPGIMGEMKVEGSDVLEVECNLEEDFDPPVTWTTMDAEEELTYKFVSDKELHLTFEDEEITSTLVFTRID